MFEFLIDFSDLPTIYSIYIGLIMGLSLKIIWTWTVEDSFIHSLYNPSDSSRYNLSAYHLNYRKININTISKWIAKVIRRKEAPNDDEGQFFLAN